MPSRSEATKSWMGTMRNSDYGEDSQRASGDVLAHSG